MRTARAAFVAIALFALVPAAAFAQASISSPQGPLTPDVHAVTSQLLNPSVPLSTRVLAGF